MNKQTLPSMNNASNIPSFAFSFISPLYNLLSTIKLYYHYYSAYHSQLTTLIQQIEKLLLTLESPSPPLTLTTIENSLYELFYLSLTMITNSTFYDLFLKTFQKFISIISSKASNLYMITYSHFLIQILTSLLTKQISYIGIESDITSTMNHIKTISMLLHLFTLHNIELKEISISEIFKLFFEKNDELFHYAKTCTYIDQFATLIKNTFKAVLNGNIKQDNIITETKNILTYIMNMIIDISKTKESPQYNNIDYNEDSFLADKLLICVKLLRIFFKNETNVDTNNIKLLSYNEIIILTKCFVELSYWDNPKIVDATCKLFYLLWKHVFTNEIEIRREIEVMLMFIYLRRFKEYYEFISKVNENEYDLNPIETDIKIFVIELLARHFNKLISFNHSLIALYIVNDLTKIRFNIINELLLSIQAYFSINNNKLIYIKQTFLYTFQILFNKIQVALTSDKQNINNIHRIYDTIDDLSDKWLQIIRLINEGQFKSLYNYLSNEFNFNIPYTKPSKKEVITQQQLNIYTPIAKYIAILIRFSNEIDIDMLYETMGNNHAFSKCVLDEFCNGFNFKGSDFLNAYELFVSSFKIKGEQYYIYNFICNFSKKYFNDNKHLSKENGFHFKTEEEVIAFAYSTMMLNTDLHNPNVTNHMTCEAFIKNNLSNNLYQDLPEEYIVTIYNRIQQKPLKAANQRKYNFNKDNMLYDHLLSLHTFKETFCNTINNNITPFEDITSLLEQFPYDKKSFPLINIHNNLLINEHKNNYLICAYQLLFDDLFCNILSLPQDYFLMSNKDISSILNSICDISLICNKKDIIGKLISTLSSIISNSKQMVPYDLFFQITMKYNKDFHLFLDIYYKAILDVLYIKINKNQDTLRMEYMKLINDIIYKTYYAISMQFKRQNEKYSLFNLFFTSYKVDNDFTYEKYKAIVYNKLQLDVDVNTNSAIANNDTNNQHNEIINLTQIFNEIKKEQEQFMFFISVAINKLNTHNQKEFYLSLLFLKEILKDLNHKDFLTIWQNLNIVFRSKMDFNSINKFTNDDNNNHLLFDILYINFIMHEIITQYFISIENEDYYHILESYLTINTSEVLFIILENNNSLILKSIEQNKKIADYNFNALLKLIYKSMKLSPILKQGIINSNNITSFTNYIKAFDFLINILHSYNNYVSLSNDSIMLLEGIITEIYDPNIITVLIMNNFNFIQVFNFVETLILKLIEVLPGVNDVKYNLYIYLMQFCFKCALNINEQVQVKFIGNVIKMFKIKIPYERYEDILTILINWNEPFLMLRKMYNGCWKDVIEIFYCLLSNNDDIKSHLDYIEKVGVLFVKKYIYGYIEEKKRGFMEEVSECEKNIIKVFTYIKHNLISGKKEGVEWFEKLENEMKEIFGDLIK